jgi:hypothetical protein
VANLFVAGGKLEVAVSGGVIYPRLGVLVGPRAVEAFQKIRADVRRRLRLRPGLPLPPPPDVGAYSLLVFCRRRREEATPASARLAASPAS